MVGCVDAFDRGDECKDVEPSFSFCDDEEEAEDDGSVMNASNRKALSAFG